jgi:hypothetical protein
VVGVDRSGRRRRVPHLPRRGQDRRGHERPWLLRHERGPGDDLQLHGAGRPTRLSPPPRRRPTRAIRSSTSS